MNHFLPAHGIAFKMVPLGRKERVSCYAMANWVSTELSSLASFYAVSLLFES